MVGFNGTLGKYNNSAYTSNNQYSLPNFNDKQISSLFIQNFGVIFIIHLCLIFFYSITLLVTSLSFLIEDSFLRIMRRIRELFQFDALLIMHLIFILPITIFININFQNIDFENFYASISIVISFGYCITLFTIGFFFIYCIIRQN